MDWLLNAPEETLCIAGLIALLFLFAGKRRTVDIQWHSTYFVLSLPFMVVVLSFLLGLNSLVYWWLPSAKRMPWLTIGHVGLLILATFALLLLALLFRKLIIRLGFGRVQNIIFRVLGLLLLGQVLGIANWFEI